MRGSSGISKPKKSKIRDRDQAILWVVTEEGVPRSLLVTTEMMSSYSESEPKSSWSAWGQSVSLWSVPRHQVHVGGGGGGWVAGVRGFRGAEMQGSCGAGRDVGGLCAGGIGLACGLGCSTMCPYTMVVPL